MIRERWFVDDYEFTDGDIRDVEYRTGQLVTPAGRGGNAVVPQRTGQVWRPKVHDQGVFTLSIWFGISQQQAQQQWDDILKACMQPHRLPTWRRITAAGEVRVCLGEVVASTKPVPVGQLGYRADLQIDVPRSYWHSDLAYVMASNPLGLGLEGLGVDPLGGSNTITVDLVGLAPSTAALEELVLRIDGLAVNPVITDITDRGRGEVLSYAGSIPDGTSLTLDSGQWWATGGGGLAPNQAAVNYTGDRYLTIAAPPPGVTPRLQLTADQIGPHTKLTVSGYRSYLC